MNLEWHADRICREWWLGLMGRSRRGSDGKLLRGAHGAVRDFGAEGAEPDRADRAAFRKLARGSEINLTEAYSIKQFWALAEPITKHFGTSGWEVREEKLHLLIASAAAAMAHITETPQKPNSLPRLLAGWDDEARKGEEKPFAEVRMKRLLRARGPADTLQNMLRAIAILKRQAPPGEVGAAIIFWDMLPSIKRRWARDYWQPGMPLPEDDKIEPNKDAA
jgi:CRISPR type I-E-associated protein CasB/Cse2